MNEKPKNREWVKNAAIIFLAVLLVLTFFSNTIMNHSLPEVATQMVNSGSVTARVRGTGTVVANGNHEVKAESTRVIRSVLVKAGQQVETGDVLFTLGEGSSEEIEAAEKELRSLQASYNRSAASMPYSDYTTEERQLKKLKEAFDEAKKAEEIAKKAAEKAADYDTQRIDAQNSLAAAELKRDTAKELYETELAQKTAALEDAKKNVASEEQIKEWEDKIAELIADAESDAEEYNKEVAELEQKVTEKQAEVDAQQQVVTEAQAAVDQFIEDFGALEDLKTERDRLANDINVALDEATKQNLNAQLDEVLDKIKQIEDPTSQYNTDLNALNNDLSTKTDTLTSLQTELSNLQTDLENAKAQAGSASSEHDAEIAELRAKIDAAENNEEVKKAKEALDAVSRDAYDAAVLEVEKWKTIYETILETNGTAESDAYKAAKKARETAEDAYLTAKESLEASKNADARSAYSSYVSLQEISEDIEIAKKKLEDLLGGEDKTIVAKVSGTVQSVEATAGDTKKKDDVLCIIEVPDMGYTMSFSVTNEQANRLRIGDTATVSNFYWGNEIKATLNSIKIDPKNPQTSKLLTFDLDGNVTAGSELTISVGQKSATYDIIIPSSAIRSDANGSFVLRVDAKSSPLGNRYIARRIPVEILASDDTSSAVTAELSNGDYVITTSTAPIKSGDMVRLANS
ncbi:MAG: HlyD family efflux transporter periplasmic adaptor subunit [Oscillospiraceae bacterium]|nr:HlyD family efflux transporter periplasmic adaptor subunit [Oscillospiraceae bacterium]